MTTEHPRTETEAESTAVCAEEQGAVAARWSRRETVARLVALDAARAEGQSERGFAEDSGTPRSTLIYWRRRRENLGGEPMVGRLFESPEGLAFLHQLVMAILFVLTLRSPDGIRMVCELLELSGLSDFVASSYGSVQKMATRMQAVVNDFDARQRAVLVPRMTPKRITTCQDETFHPEICLVAIEPVSGYILLAEYAEDREEATWTKAMTAALKGMPVKIEQVTSDEARALLANARAMGAHHSPDLFHVQRAVTKAMGVPLARREDQAVRALEAAMTASEQVKLEKSWHESQPRGPGRPPDFDARLRAAESEVTAATAHANDAQADREAQRSAVAGMGKDYHPYRLSDGAPQTAEAVDAALREHIRSLVAIADKADLPERCHEGIAKAERVVDDMTATIRNVHEEKERRLATLQLPAHQHAAVAEKLVPALYLERAASRASTAEERRQLMSRAATLAEPLRDPAHPLQALEPARRAEIQRVAQDCADLFQRSSSNVEGHNGRLSLFHHGLHRLEPGKLAALTVVQNYFVTRPDGTTAAERFFGVPPDDIFEHLVTHMPHPPRPARKREKKANRSCGQVLHAA